LALSVPLSRFTLGVGGGSAFYVRPCSIIKFMKLKDILLFIIAAIFILFVASIVFHILSSAAPH
jgi:hypothetical protein